MNKIDAQVIVLDLLNWSSKEKMTVTMCADMIFAKAVEIILKVQPVKVTNFF